jgi:hypothetical protein
MTEIYVYIRKEGTDVWRPVEAVESEDGTFLITSPPVEDQEWQFPSGSRVKCEQRKFESGSALVAVRYAE